MATNNTNFANLIAESADGSKKVIAQSKKLRGVIIQDLRLLGRYVEKIADADIATFKSSGFEPASTARTPQTILSSVFRNVQHGDLSGELVVRMKAIPNASSYALRYATTANATAGTWTSQLQR